MIFNLIHIYYYLHIEFVHPDKWIIERKKMYQNIINTRGELIRAWWDDKFNLFIDITFISIEVTNILKRSTY